MKQNKRRKQTLESAQYGLEISFKNSIGYKGQAKVKSSSVADPDLELRGGGLDLLAMAAIFLSVISSFFTQNKVGPSPRSATVVVDKSTEMHSYELNFGCGKRKITSRTFLLFTYKKPDAHTKVALCSYYLAGVKEE